uniref:RGS domain-containing protein n=1 Tax=Macrostomum lignano TaxID=282301 RepID=A0A1I8GIC0_9PLAT
MDRKESGRQALENLEDMLIYDDMFLDYFNAFLSLPAFPQVLQYHRLTGTFRIVDTADDSLVEWSNSSEPLYGATDDERETIMTWAQNERLPLFTKTELYREYKLCKLLLRPVDARKIGTRPGTFVRGYSRTSGSMGSLTDTDADDGSSADVDDDDDDEDEEFEDSQDEDGEYNTTDLTSSSGMSNRPPTHAKSLPDRLTGKAGSSGARRRRRRRPRDIDTTGDLDESGTTGAVDASVSGLAIDASTATPSRIQQHRRLKASQQAGDGRTYSAPHNYQEFAMLPMSTDFDLLRDLQEAPAVVSFSTRAGETGGAGDSLDLKGLEARQNLPFDRLKELMLANRQGVQEFFEFLRPTAGLHLVDFWLDCEFYKDTALERSDADNRQTRGRLLRDLQDKYRLRLTEEAKAQMRNAANDHQKANSILLRTQYDVLRRLRSYWLPRYIIHKERELTGQTFSDLQQAWLNDATRRRQLDDRIRSAKGGPQLQQPALAAKPVSASRPFQARLRDALTVDRIAGGPFRSFLEMRHRDPELLACLMFFQEVEEYSRRDERTADRFLRLGHAWNIFNRYLNVSAAQPVKVDKRENQLILDALRRSKDTVPAKVFAKAQDSVVVRMGDTWLRFLKEDVKNFLESSVSHRDSDSPPKTSDEIQVYIENGKIIVKRIQPERSQAQLQLQRRRSWDFLTDEEKAERRKAAAERRRVTELERKKALKAARKRLKEMEESGRKDYEGRASAKKVEEEEEVEKAPELKEMTKNRAVMALFKKYASDKEGKDSVNALSLYQETLEFLELPPGVSDKAKKKRDGNALYLYKTYLEKGCKRRVEVTSERLQQRLTVDKDRPKTPTLKDLSSHLHSKLNLLFSNFWQYQSEEMGIDMSALKNMSEKELRMRADLDVGAGGRRGKKSDSQGASRASRRRGRRDKNSNDDDFIAAFDLAAVLPRGGGGGGVRRRAYDLTDLSKYIKHPISNLLRDFVQETNNASNSSSNMLDASNASSILAYSKATGKAPPTKEDKVEFLVALEKNLSGPLSLQMLYFYRYLMQYAVQDKVPHLDKNLFFYVEAQKYKEFALGGCDEEFLKRKIHVISSIFLESVFPPPLQITVSNDVHQRTLRNAQKFYSPKFKEEISPTIFDEAQFAVFKEMLPYWAGFMKQWTPTGKEYRPVSQQKRMLEERLQKFEKSDKPNVNFKLPELPAHSGGPISSLTMSLMDGIKW